MLKKYKDIIFRTLLFIAFLFAIFYLTNYVAENEPIQNLVAKFGLAGVFVASVISGFNLIFPVPIATFIPLFRESGFELLPLVIVITAGMTTGDAISYSIGRLGRKLIIADNDKDKSWFLNLILRARDKYKVLPYVILFFFASFAPLPNELTVLPLGILGYRISYLLPILLVGNFIFNYWTSQGVRFVFDLF